MQIVIYGTAKLSQLIYYNILEDKAFEVIGFVADEEFISNELFCGFPVSSSAELTLKYDPKVVNVLVVGPYGSAKKREEMYQFITSLGYKCVNYISKRAIVPSNLDVGVNNIILPGVYIDYMGSLGDGNIFRPNCYLGHDFKVGNYNYFAPGCNVAGYSEITDYCFIGIGATVTEHKKLATGTTVGAQSLLLINSETYSTYIGVPAKKMEKR